MTTQPAPASSTASAYENEVFAEVDPSAFRKFLRASPKAFIEFTIPDILGEGEVEPFHELIFTWFTDMDHPRDVIALPRDHAKTTYLRLAYIYLMFYTPVQFFVYMGPTLTAAAASLQVIWSRLFEENITTLYGGVQSILVQRESEGQFQFYVRWYDENDVPRTKLVILRALGAQQQLRGMNVRNLRPEFIGCDDIEDEEAVRTEQGYEKFKAWFDNVFMRAVSRVPGRNKVAQIGNLVGTRTLLADNLADPDWRSLRLGIIKADGKPLWPSKFPLAEIQRDFRAAQRRRQLNGWFAELMNAPLNVTNSLIRYEDITFTPRRLPREGLKSFITIDPAGDGAKSDDFAIVLHTIDETGVPQVSEYHAQQGMSPLAATEVIWDMSQRWGCFVVGCESVRLQKVFLSFFELVFVTRGVENVDFVPVEIGKQFKTDRLRVWASALAAGEYTLPADDWAMTQQLLGFDTTKTNNRDDMIDAASQGLYMLKHYDREIFADRASVVANPMPPAVAGSSEY